LTPSSWTLAHWTRQRLSHSAIWCDSLLPGEATTVKVESHSWRKKKTLWYRPELRCFAKSPPWCPSREELNNNSIEDVATTEAGIFHKIICDNNLLTSNLNQVCVCAQTNILNAEFKWDKIFVTKWKIYEEKKPLRGSQTQEIHYPKTKLIKVCFLSP
jgi:hypothetical protein